MGGGAWDDLTITGNFPTASRQSRPSEGKKDAREYQFNESDESPARNVIYSPSRSKLSAPHPDPLPVPCLSQHPFPGPARLPVTHPVALPFALPATHPAACPVPLPVALPFSPSGEHAQPVSTWWLSRCHDHQRSTSHSWHCYHCMVFGNPETLLPFGNACLTESLSGRDPRPPSHFI